MKWIYAVLFSFLSLAGILKDLTVFINFKANQEYIIMTMCTGASEPINTCNGSCYLTKQLTLVHDHGQEEDSQAPRNLKTKITFFSEERLTETKPAPVLLELSYHTYFTASVTSGHPMAVFQPPKYS